MNLLFAVNQNFTDLLCNCIRSIVKNGGADHYNAYILHSDLQDDIKTRIDQAAGEKVTCHYITVDESMFEGFPESNRYPKQIYYRLAAPLLLPKTLERVLYLDVDLVVINSLEELYNTDFEGNYYIAATHTTKLEHKFNEIRLDIKKEEPYINTGVLLINLQKLRKTNIEKDVIQYVKENSKKLILPDQDIIAALYGSKIKLVDALKYNLGDRGLNWYNINNPKKQIRLKWVCKNTVIIHYYGKNNFETNCRIRRNFYEMQ